MADPRQYDYLLSCLDQESGRGQWVKFKLKTKWIDLSTADFSDSNLRDYDLSDTNLSTAIFLGADLAGADLSDATLGFADLRRVNLQNASLDRTDLSSANLQGANLTDTRLEDANLKGARLMGANLVGADLRGADLTDADLRGAILKYVSLAGTCIEGANVAEADLTGAVLDDDAPERMRNFDLAVVDDRKYRVRRSRLSAERDGGAAITPIAPQPATGMVKGEGRWSETEEVAYEAGSIPVREAEPNLDSTEGCCRVLNLPTDPSMAEVVKAFRTKAKLFHPDKVRHLSERLQQLAADEFRRVQKAYEALTRRTTRPIEGIRWPVNVPRRESVYDYTIADYIAMARVNPGDTSILYNLAWIQFEEGFYVEAVDNLNRVLELDPADADANYNLMIVRLYMELDLPPMRMLDLV